MCLSQLLNQSTLGLLGETPHSPSQSKLCTWTRLPGITSHAQRKGRLGLERSPEHKQEERESVWVEKTPTIESSGGMLGCEQAPLSRQVASDGWVKINQAR